MLLHYFMLCCLCLILVYNELELQFQVNNGNNNNTTRAQNTNHLEQKTDDDDDEDIEEFWNQFEWWFDNLPIIGATMSDKAYDELERELINNEKLTMGKYITSYLRSCRGTSKPETRMNSMINVLQYLLNHFENNEIGKSSTNLICSMFKSDFKEQLDFNAKLVLLLICLNWIYINIELGYQQYLQESDKQNQEQYYYIFICIHQLLSLFIMMFKNMKKQAVNVAKCSQDTMKWFEQIVDNRTSILWDKPQERDPKLKPNANILQRIINRLSQNMPDKTNKLSLLKPKFVRAIVTEIKQIQNKHKIENNPNIEPNASNTNITNKTNNANDTNNLNQTNNVNSTNDTESKSSSWYGDSYSYSDNDIESQDGVIGNITKWLNDLSCDMNSSNSNSNDNNNNSSSYDWEMDQFNRGNNGCNYSFSSSTLISYLNPFFEKTLSIGNDVDSFVEPAALILVSSDYSNEKGSNNLFIHNDPYITFIIFSFFCKYIYTNYDPKCRNSNNYKYSKLNVFEVEWLYDCFVRRATKAGCQSGIIYWSGHGCVDGLVCADGTWTYVDLMQRHSRSHTGFKSKVICDACVGINENISATKCMPHTNYKYEPRHNLDIITLQEKNFATRTVTAAGASPGTLAMAGSGLITFGLLNCHGVRSDDLFGKGSSRMVRMLTDALDMRLHIPCYQHQGINTGVIVSNQFANKFKILLASLLCNNECKN